MTTDAELVEATLRGERAAFAALVERYQRAVVAVAARILRDHHAAQDAAQDSFVIAYQRLARLRRPAAFGAWLLRIARRQALRLARKRVPATNYDAAGRGTDCQSVLPGGTAGRDRWLDAAAERLLAAVVRLPEHETQVVMLRYFDGHPVQTIADLTGRPLGTVTKQLSRALGRLRQQLEDLAHEL